MEGKLGEELVLLVPRVKEVSARAEADQLCVQRVHELVHVHTRLRTRPHSRALRQAAGGKASATARGTGAQGSE